MGYFVLKVTIRCEKTQEYLAITEGPKTAPVTVEYPLATLMVSLTRGEAGSPDNSFFTPKLAGSEGTCKHLSPFFTVFLYTRAPINHHFHEVNIINSRDKKRLSWDTGHP